MHVEARLLDDILQVRVHHHQVLESTNQLASVIQGIWVDNAAREFPSSVYRVS
jgi:hypothetical protein